MTVIPINNLSRQSAEELADISVLLGEVLTSGSFILGKNVSRFENSLAEFVGKKHAVAVASGTDALILGLRALGVRAGVKIATQPNCGGYSTVGIRLNGGVANYVDCKDNGSMDPKALERLLTQKPDIEFAIVTHLYGLIGDISEVLEVCQKYGVKLIEDCAQSLGASTSEGMAGSFGEVSTFSFYPTKNLGAMGDAGAILTDNADLARKLKQLRQYGWGSRYYVQLDSGINSRMDEFQAAVLLARLPNLMDNNQVRRNIWLRYRAAIENSNWRIIGEDSSSFTAHLAVVVAPDGLRDQAREFLESRGVSTSVHYPLLDYQQAPWSSSAVDRCLGAEALASNIFTLPLFPTMHESEVDQVCKALHELVGRGFEIHSKA